MLHWRQENVQALQAFTTVQTLLYLMVKQKNKSCLDSNVGPCRVNHIPSIPAYITWFCISLLWGQIFKAMSERYMHKFCYSLTVFLHIPSMTHFGNLACNLHLCNVSSVGADMTDVKHYFLSLQLHQVVFNFLLLY